MSNNATRSVIVDPGGIGKVTRSVFNGLGTALRTAFEVYLYMPSTLRSHLVLVILSTTVSEPSRTCINLLLSSITPMCIGSPRILNNTQSPGSAVSFLSHPSLYCATNSVMRVLSSIL